MTGAATAPAPAPPRPRRRWRRLNRRLREPFPAVGGNSVVPIEQGPAYYERMLAAIRAARASVDVEQYLWDPDDVGLAFVEALRDAAARGLRVRALIDASGAGGVEGPLAAVDAAGGDVRVFNPFRLRFLNRWIHRTHKKLLVCDGSVAYAGGAGFATHWSSGARLESPWHDRMFEIRGPAVRQVETVFETDFHRWRPRHGGARCDVEGRDGEPAAAGGARLRVLRGWPDAFDFKKALIAAVRGASGRVWLGSPYFIPPPSLFRALRRALQRGVDVRLVLPSGNTAHPVLFAASRRHYRWFLRRGARIHEYAEGFYHAKLAVVDGTHAIFGSSNLDYWSWDRNAELDVVATDPATVESLAAEFERDRARSRPVTLEDLRATSLRLRIRQRVVGWIEDWL